MNATNKMRQWIVLALGLGSLGLAILVGSVPTVGAAAMPTQVSVVNTPTVNANQNGTWSVGISGTPSVRVTPTPTEWYQAYVQYDRYWTNTTGKVFVIDTVTAWPFDETYPRCVMFALRGGDQYMEDDFLLPILLTTSTKLAAPPNDTLGTLSCTDVFLTGHLEPAAP